MADSFIENKEIVKFYQDVRSALSDLLFVEYRLDVENVELIIKDLDKLVADRTKKILILHDDEVTELHDDETSPEDLEPHIESIKSGVFNLVVTMCMHYMNETTPENARIVTIQYLESITEGLRQLNQTEEGTNA